MCQARHAQRSTLLKAGCSTLVSSPLPHSRPSHIHASQSNDLGDDAPALFSSIDHPQHHLLPLTTRANRRRRSRRLLVGTEVLALAATSRAEAEVPSIGTLTAALDLHLRANRTHLPAASASDRGAVLALLADGEVELALADGTTGGRAREAASAAASFDETVEGAAALAGAVPTATLEEAVFDMVEFRKEASLMTMSVTYSVRRLSERATRKVEVKMRKRGWL